MSETRCCTVDGCEKPVIARGWCSKHYYRWYRHGTVMRPGRRSSVEHGASMYTNYGCRCETCTTAHTRSQARRKKERSELMRSGVATNWVKHGIESTYTNWGCRCDPCRAARSAYNALRYAQRTS